ncbi:MAG TPA: hypothetical protein VK627_05570 [Edaphobacter sp.]|jgi:hypothetical protein|nr:hypothetical protein [Edaphobacter sp.]
MKTSSEFHDGAFNGLLIEKDVAHFFLETSHHEKFVIVAQQIQALRLHDVLAGNIIFDVEVFDSTEISLSDVLEAHPYSNEAQGKSILQKCRDQNLLLLRINPSYGASLTAIASSVEVRSQEQWGRLLPA